MIKKEEKKKKNLYSWNSLSAHWVKYVCVCVYKATKKKKNQKASHNTRCSVSRFIHHYFTPSSLLTAKMDRLTQLQDAIDSVNTSWESIFYTANN